MKNKNLTFLDVCKPNLLDEINIVKYNQTFLDKVENIKISTEAVFYSFVYFFKNIKIGISNILYFLPTIWNNRYWDYEYTIALIIKQLEYQRDGFKNEDTVLEISRIVKQINNTLEYIDNWSNYAEVFDKKSQNLLAEIQNTEDEIVKEELKSAYIRKMYKFEMDCWNKIFNSMKKNMRAWWS